MGQMDENFRRHSLNFAVGVQPGPFDMATSSVSEDGVMHMPRSRASRPSSISTTHTSHGPRPINMTTPTRPLASQLSNLLPSAPASPPTPAPSPTPQLHRLPTWNTAREHEDTFLRDARPHFLKLDSSERQRFLAEILNLCDSQQLSFVLNYVSPRLKKDPFKNLPNELSLRILSFVDDPKTLARASQVSKLWHALLSDDLTWKKLCEKHSYRRLSNNPPIDPALAFSLRSRSSNDLSSPQIPISPRDSSYINSLTKTIHSSGFESTIDSKYLARRRPKAMSYKTHFKQRYMVETAWRTGGRLIARHITPDQGVVTSLHLTPNYIIVALDNAKIHVFAEDGRILRTLQGHVMGVWAMVPWENTLVSGGCDRDVRVWDLETGDCKMVLRGHTSTVRCLKMSDSRTAISGSRDTTLRVWDIETGHCKNILLGHAASVRCLEIHGDLVVSGSYDTTAKIWSISEGVCLRTLSGHFSQIYAIAFDGMRIATGSLDTSVRIWEPSSGNCLAVLQGHTSLVGQLQLRGSTLVTGGSDGSVRVWDLKEYKCIHRLAAHDNSVTSLQFDEQRIVSGGSDGRVKIWDLRTGVFVRELNPPAEAVWRVAFEDEKAVILSSRAGRTTMDVYSFSPPVEALKDYYQGESGTSSGRDTPASSLRGGIDGSEPDSQRSSGLFDRDDDTVMGMGDESMSMEGAFMADKMELLHDGNSSAPTELSRSNSNENDTDTPSSSRPSVGGVRESRRERRERQAFIRAEMRKEQERERANADLVQRKHDNSGNDPANS